MACHCRGCQRMTASAFSLALAIPAEGFELTAGEPVLGGLHGPTQQYFCPHCLSWLFTRTARLEGMVMLRTPLLEDAAAFPPFVDIYVSEKLPWAQTGAKHAYPQFPSLEDYGELMRAYAAGVAEEGAQAN